MVEPLTPKGKGTREGRPIRENEGPILMNPGIIVICSYCYFNVILKLIFIYIYIYMLE